MVGDIIDFAEMTDWKLLTEQKELLSELSGNWQEWIDNTEKTKKLFTDHKGKFDKKRYNENIEWISPRLDKVNGIISFIDNIQDMLVDEYGFKLDVIYPKLDKDEKA